MRTTRVVWATVALLGFLASGCLLIPEVKDKIVELAVGASTSATFDGNGNASDPLAITQQIDLGGSNLDLKQVLDDAGVDVEDVTDVKVSAVSYRITRADAEPARQVMGSLTVQRQGGTEQPLISNFTIPVGAVTGYQTAPLAAAGIGELNAALSDLLAQLKLGQTPVESLTLRVAGTASPTTGTLDFAYAVKLDVSIVGTVEVSVPE